MKKTIATLALTLVMASSMAAEEQRYLLTTDVAAVHEVSITSGDHGVIYATFQTAHGRWVKHTLTPTTEHLYGSFGEPVVKLSQIFPNP